MANLKDLIARIRVIRETVESKLPDVAVGLAITGKALAERKIKEKGFGAQYSDNEYPAKYLLGKELNQRGSKFLADRGVNLTTGAQGQGRKKRAKKGQPGTGGVFSTETNWAQFRQAQGLQIGHVDLTYSGKMFANMQPLKVIRRGDLFLAPLGATNKEAQDKMNENRDRYGDFMDKALDNSDRQLMQDYVINSVTDILESIQPV